MASTRLRDPNFIRSVVLMVRHDADGALGLIVNQPLPILLGEALTASEIDAGHDSELPLFKGGPCNGPLMALTGMPMDDGEEVMDGLQFCVKQEDIRELLEHPETQTRFVLGYAGWGSEQLEQELASGSWVVLPATLQDVFSGSVSSLWDRLMGRANLIKFIPPDSIPDEPGIN